MGKKFQKVENFISTNRENLRYLGPLVKLIFSLSPLKTEEIDWSSEYHIYEVVMLSGSNCVSHVMHNSEQMNQHPN